MVKKSKPGSKARPSGTSKPVSVSPLPAKTVERRAPQEGTPKKRQVKQVKRSALPPNIATFSDLIEEIDSEIQAICRRLREIVFETLPSAIETVYPALRLALYKAPIKICGIQPSKNQCHFYFTEGAQLPDPHGLLRGNGQKIRHVPVRSLEDIPADGIKTLLQAAYLRSTQDLDR